MANLAESPDWVPGIYQLETEDPVLGGPNGIDNLQGKQLGSRTLWLRQRLDQVINGQLTAAKAKVLETSRTFTFRGAASGNARFDGSADVAIDLTLADSGAKAGSYPVVSINAKGLVTGGRALLEADIPILPWSKINARPNTLAGYGITDALNASIFHWNNLPGRPNAYPPAEHAHAWVAITGKPDSLAGYGIAPATQAEAEAGADNSKPMTALRVFQAVAKRAIQATETLAGIARIATRTEVEAGKADNLIVTPSTLRLGFAVSWGTNGYIALPSWLGGLMFQWGILRTAHGAVSYAMDVTFPLPFPATCFAVAISHGIAAYDLDYSGAIYRQSKETVQMGDPSRTGFKAQLTVLDTYVANVRSLRWIAIGR